MKNLNQIKIKYKSLHNNRKSAEQTPKWWLDPNKQKYMYNQISFINDGVRKKFTYVSKGKKQIRKSVNKEEVFH